MLQDAGWEVGGSVDGRGCTVNDSVKDYQLRGSCADDTGGVSVLGLVLAGGRLTELPFEILALQRISASEPSGGSTADPY